MKKIFLFLFIIFCFILTADLFSKTAQRSFKGRIINTKENYIEVKSGKVEIKLYLGSGMKVYKGKNEVTVNDIEICQVIQAYYIVNNKQKELVKVVILKESDCLQ